MVQRQLATLQGLCRTLQAERANLTAKLKIFQGTYLQFIECVLYLLNSFLVNIEAIYADYECFCQACFKLCNFFWHANKNCV